jgi:hypothetical protein
MHASHVRAEGDIGVEMRIPTVKFGGSQDGVCIVLKFDENRPCKRTVIHFTK